LHLPLLLLLAFAAMQISLKWVEVEGGQGL
jgi:hypothetical protein